MASNSVGGRDERSSTGKAGFASDVVDRYSAILYRLIPGIEPSLYQPNCLTFLSHHSYQLSFLSCLDSQSFFDAGL